MTSGAAGESGVTRAPFIAAGLRKRVRHDEGRYYSLSREHAWSWPRRCPAPLGHRYLSVWTWHASIVDLGAVGSFAATGIRRRRSRLSLRVYLVEVVAARIGKASRETLRGRADGITISSLRHSPVGANARHGTAGCLGHVDLAMAVRVNEPASAYALKLALLPLALRGGSKPLRSLSGLAPSSIRQARRRRAGGGVRCVGSD